MADIVAIVDTGVANIASLIAAFERLGYEAELTRDSEHIESAPYLTLPGVGAFAAGMKTLREAGLVDVLRERFEQGRPSLAVCLGMQLLARKSEESPGVDGLGVVDVDVNRFADEVRVPQFGWNEVEASADCDLLSDGYAYFANSYCIMDRPEGWAVATSEYGGPFVAAMERGAVLACQFHPEISGPWGLSLLESWLERGASRC